MAHDHTASVARNIFGEELYQERARRALPILVRQALSQKEITYENLAEELGMSNPRNLNFVLGSVGTTLKELSVKWAETIPFIQCLVVNKSTRLPGKGINELLLDGQSADQLTRGQRQALVDGALARTYAFQKWHLVLNALDLKPTQSVAAPFVELARHFVGAGESADHKRLKEAVAKAPELVGLHGWEGQGLVEYPLPSGDALDVLFQRSTTWIGVEVKSARSPDADISRGLFQCVKYLAVLEAWRGYTGEVADVRVILALETALPESLVDLRNSLGVEVVESVGMRVGE